MSNAEIRIVTASRRTDIPAFFAPWLLRRLHEGFCHALNPVSGLVHRIGLTPSEAPVIGLYTRDPRPVLPHLRSVLAEGHAVFAHVTLNGYPKALEPRAPVPDEAVQAISALSGILGEHATVWRYDPVVLSDRFDEGYHERSFSRLASRLRGRVRECYVSFLDPYGKTRRNMPDEAGRPQYVVGERHLRLAASLAAIADDNGMELRSCSEPLLDRGVRPGACVDASLVTALAPGRRVPRRSPLRDGCGCAASVDIGAYDTCAAGCAYCYATESPDIGLDRQGEHDPEDTILWRPAHLRGEDLHAAAASSGERKGDRESQERLFRPDR